MAREAGSRATTVYSLGQAARAAATTAAGINTRPRGPGVHPAAVSISRARGASTCTPIRASSSSDAAPIASIASGGQRSAAQECAVGTSIGEATLSEPPEGLAAAAGAQPTAGRR
jgi:hypothetical protein